jgi:redox-sensing transcriptional repressor
MAVTPKPAVSPKTVARLSLYRRLLSDLGRSGAVHVYSHQLAHLAGVSAAQVRRDFMVIGYSGSPNRGYQIDSCLASIDAFLDGASRQDLALIGLGRLGRAVLAHFAGRRPLLRIAAGFDVDPALIGTVVDGCPVYDVAELDQVLNKKGIRVAILAVPPEHAQALADRLVAAGIRSIVDFTAVPLKVPDEVYVHYMDITSALESAAFFARQEVTEEPAVEADAADAPEAEMQPMIRTIDSLLETAGMKLEDLARSIGARILTPGPSQGAVITRIYAGDRVSDLLSEASDKTLLVTNLANVQMVRVAELMEVPGICFVDDIDPDREILDLAAANHTMVMVSPTGVFETCGIIYQYLASALDTANQQSPKVEVSKGESATSGALQKRHRPSEVGKTKPSSAKSG